MNYVFILAIFPTSFLPFILYPYLPKILYSYLPFTTWEINYRIAIVQNLSVAFCLNEVE